MDEQKKSESSGDDVEQVGPYQLQEQVPQDEYSRGELYRATHETSGATALVLKPAAEDEKGSVRLTDWRVRFISSASPGYVAMQVEEPPRSVAPDSHSVESLVCTFEDVREAVGRMDHALHESNESRPGWRLGLAALSGVAALVVALLPAALAPVAEVGVQEEATVEVWVTDVHVDPVPVRSGDAPRPGKTRSGRPVRRASRWRCPAYAGSPSPSAPAHRRPWPTRANAFCPSRCRALLSPAWTVATATSPADASPLARTRCPYKMPDIIPAHLPGARTNPLTPSPAKREALATRLARAERELQQAQRGMDGSPGARTRHCEPMPSAAYQCMIRLRTA